MHCAFPCLSLNRFPTFASFASFFLLLHLVANTSAGMSAQVHSATATVPEGPTLPAASSYLTALWKALEAAWPYLPDAERKTLRCTCAPALLQHDRLCSTLRLTLDADVPAPRPEELEAVVAGRLERSKPILHARDVRLKGSGDLVVEEGAEDAEELAGEPERAEEEAERQRAAAEVQERRMCIFQQPDCIRRPIQQLLCVV